MEDKVNMTPLVQVLAQLRKEGIATDFTITEEGRLSTMDGKESFTPQQVQIVNFYRFEGESYPGDMAILYVLETSTGLKGTISDAYGLYSDEAIENFMKQVKDLGKDLDKHSGN
ncbi:hypothetical protein [Pontibacter ruber]|uniref:Phosphoribosylpyrophosphate synthetase n=1 Tax=Pontibacter ruber TaxID=1343895 RepID=A0ABW5D2F0_9BACT|nr:hypothetical protein [Pontibacter ruber]